MQITSPVAAAHLSATEHHSPVRPFAEIKADSFKPKESMLQPMLGSHRKMSIADVPTELTGS